MIDAGAFRVPAVVTRNEKEDDGTGGRKRELREVSRPLIAFLDAGVREREAQAQLGVRVDRIILAPVDAGVKRGDWIEAEDVKVRVVSVRRRSTAATGGGPYLYVLGSELETE